eukprot:m.307960 g.307960  ORF g.307960 m.307960 type:complete len:123 (+) comp43123_c0_seq1:80-448(+)
MSGRQEQTNKEILQSLQEQREKLKMKEQQQQSRQESRRPAPSPSSRAAYSRTRVINPALQPGPPQKPSESALKEQTEAYHMLLSQRAALQHAQSQSYGCYITQDSQFGNLILPVLPRMDGNT